VITTALSSLSSTRTTTGSLCAGILLEHYRYPPGPPGADDMHTHDDYQLGLCLDFPGEYVLRSGSIAVPVGTLSIIHPGELHAARDPIERRTPATFRMFYLPLDLVQRVSTELSSRPPALPFFATPVIDDRHIIDRFLALDAALTQSGARLAQEDALLAALTALFIRYADTRHTLPNAPDALPALKRVRDYLHAHAADNVSLATLATLADLSPFQLCRAFRATYGMPPHHYLNRVRIDHARRLLAAGQPPAQVAAAAGFADQSHFGRHFKRLIGVTPGAYAARRKNVLYRTR
jgi:AraC-like DNA-binding protein